MDAKKIQGWLNGEILRSGWLRKQYKLIGLIVLLTFIYILGGYHSMQQHHHLTDLKNEAKDAKFEYLTIAAERAEATRQSQIYEALKDKGSNLRDSKQPAILVR